MNKQTINVTNVPTVGSIIISTKLKDKIDYLHRTVGKLEWSGILLYKLSSGNISKFSNLIFKAVDVYPMDIGTAANTEFKYDPDAVIDMYDSIPEALELSTGLCHSHQGFNSFISGTDFDEIKTNSSSYNYYISLVVSFDEQYVCKIAFPSKTIVTKKSVIKDNRGKLVTINQVSEEDNLLLGDLKIVFEQDSKLEKWFTDKVADIDRVKKSRVVTSNSKWSGTPNTAPKSTSIPLAGGYSERITNYKSDYPDPYNYNYNRESFFDKPRELPTATKEEELTNTEKFVLGLTGFGFGEYLADMTKKDVVMALEFVATEWNTSDIAFYQQTVDDYCIEAHKIIYKDDILFKEHLKEAINYISNVRGIKYTRTYKRFKNILYNCLKDYDTVSKV